MSSQSSLLDVTLVALACVSVGCSGLLCIYRLLKPAFGYVSGRRKRSTCSLSQDFHPFQHPSWRHLVFLDIMQPKDKAAELVLNWRRAAHRRFQGTVLLPISTLYVISSLVYMVQTGVDASAILNRHPWMPATSICMLVILASLWHDRLYLWQLNILIAFSTYAASYDRADSLGDLQFISHGIDFSLAVFAGMFGHTRLTAVITGVSCTFRYRRVLLLDPDEVSHHMYNDLSWLCVVVAFARDRLQHELAAATVDARNSRQTTSIFTSLLSVVCDVVVHLDTNLRFTKSSPHLAALLMKDGSSVCLKNQSFLGLIAPCDRPTFTQSLGSRANLANGEATALQLPLVQMADATGRRVQLHVFHVPYTNEDDQVLHLIGLCEIGAEEGESSFLEVPAQPSAPSPTATVFGAVGPETGSQGDGLVGLQQAFLDDQVPAERVGTLGMSGEKIAQTQQRWLKHVIRHSRRRTRSKSSGDGSHSSTSSSRSGAGTRRSPSDIGSVSDLGSAGAVLKIARLSESLGAVECVVEASPPFRLIRCSSGFSAVFGNTFSSMLQSISRLSLRGLLSRDHYAACTHAVEQLLEQDTVNPGAQLGMEIPITLQPPQLRRSLIDVETICSLKLESTSENQGLLISMLFTGGELRIRTNSSSQDGAPRIRI
eukprot:TRINITY_DN15274_c0_g1_i1.p1 TRINITY_DN15274_c0_g1~~TRINITY_DN15274_c0_g1_i1.p1  ORF type:complete len:680 (+),score=62.11 TRINITY_DN15274_c0_g1_i1:74-2041(+)